MMQLWKLPTKIFQKHDKSATTHHLPCMQDFFINNKDNWSQLTISYYSRFILFLSVLKYFIFHNFCITYYGIQSNGDCFHYSNTFTLSALATIINKVLIKKIFVVDCS